MASRAEQKAQLRAERILGEQAVAAQARRRRMIAAGGVLLLTAIVAVVVVILMTSSSPSHAAAGSATRTNAPVQSANATAQQRVNALLAGIPEPTDDTLGKASAPITIIEYGDLECAVCDSFALSTSARVSDGTHGSGIEDTIIDTLVRTGRAKLVYDALDTATSGGATPGEFVPQQAAVYAAGLQGKAWYFIELFYNEQHPEGTNYVNQTFLDGIAKQVPGLDYATWLKDSRLGALITQVTADNTRGNLVDAGEASTPTVVVQSKTRGTIASEGIPTIGALQEAIKNVQ